jgi:hypothetical protein
VRGVRDDVVGVEPGDPGRGRAVEGELARGREVVHPLEVEEARAVAARDLLRRVARAGVDDDDLVEGARDRREATPERALLVPDDHGQRDCHLASPLRPRRGVTTG